MNKEYVRKVSKKAKDAVYDLICMRRPYKYLVSQSPLGFSTLNFNGMSIDEFRDLTVKKCREVTDLIWELWDENNNNQSAIGYLTPLLLTYNFIVELGDNPNAVSDEEIEYYLKLVYPQL